MLRIIDALIETDSRMRYALSKKTLLETGLIRCSRAAETATVNELLKQVAELKKNFKSGNTVAGGVAEATADYAVVEQKKKRPDGNEIELLLSNWHRIIDQVGKADALSKNYLLNTAPLRTDQTRLVIGFDPEFADDRKRLEDDRTRLALSRAIDKYLGRMLSISFEPLKADDRRPLPADQPATGKTLSGEGQELTGVSKWYANPVVKTVVDAFNGEITDVRE